MTKRTLRLELHGKNWEATVELDQNVRLRFAGNGYEPPDWQVEDRELRVNDRIVSLYKYPRLLNRVIDRGRIV